MATLNHLPWKKKGNVNPVVVLTGAGVSMPIGLPGGPELAEAVLRKLSKKSHNIKLDDILTISRSTPLETVFQILADRIGDKRVQKIIAGLNNDTPASIHFFLSELAIEDKIKAIYTFNFDLLHEYAFPSKSIDSEIHGRAVLKRFSSKNGDTLQLWKVHGSCDSAGVITITEYIKGFSSTVLDSLCDNLKNAFWLILGYGGWDIDFQEAISSALRNGYIPNEVIWVDRSFPEHGGRTDIINTLKSYGVIVQKLEYDFNVLLGCNTLVDNQWKGNLSDLIQHLEFIDQNICVGILAETALNCNQYKIANDILRKQDKNKFLRERALFFERIGNRSVAAECFYRLALGSNQIHTRAMASIKAFTLSKGSIDCFDKVDTSVLNENEQIIFNTISSTKRTDTGGLNRIDHPTLTANLPSWIAISESITNIDGARYLISALSELARVQHEGKIWEKALEFDQSAYRIALGLSDPFVTGMCAGNIGACYMGLAENESPIKKNQYLKKAEKWLLEAIKLSFERDQFTWSLHTCNLGIVKFDLGDFGSGANLLDGALSSLEDVYPNYAICFWSDYAKFSLYESMKPECTNQEYFKSRAIEYLQKGLLLVKQLNDYDDILLLKDVAITLNKMNSLPKSMEWVFSVNLESSCETTFLSPTTA